MGDSERSTWCIYVGKAGRSNLEIGRRNGIWGFDREDKGSGISAGDGLMIVENLAAGPGVPSGFPRVPSAEALTGTAATILRGTITSGIFHDSRPVWPDDVYPYRFHFDVHDAATMVPFGVDHQPRDVVEAMRLSAIRGGRAVRCARQTNESSEARTWIFQANPAYYDVRRAASELSELTWEIRQHRNEISTGDRVFLWQSGADGGVVGLATVLSDPAEIEQDEAENQFVADPSQFARLSTRVRLRVDRAVVPTLSRTAIRERISDLEIFRQAQGTNFRLTDEQARVLLGLVDQKSETVWWVNQGRTYREEREGGFLWAPSATEAGGTPFYHWTNVSHVSPGEVIIHYANGRIKAISQATSAGAVASRPRELPEGLWNEKGYQASTRYYELERPIAMEEIPSRLRSEDAGPFDRTGGAKMGYLFELDGKVAEELRGEFADRWPDGSPWAGSKPRRTLKELAAELFVDQGWLQEIVELLGHKRQAIFYGPPGTGKTYVAKKLAEHLAGARDRVRLVQFHPAYSYEDFVEGYRPQEGQSGFRLVPGPLKLLAEAAAKAPGETFILVIDEVNRGNLPKVLGELYFLLEYRDEVVNLLYSPGQPFSLPKNLLIIGTMNTADRSIALIDAALRRRFHFVPFFPDREPIRHVLRRWLQANKPELLELASVVDRANQELGDRHGAIGPAHFLRDDLTAEWVERIWKYSVIPYLEEQFFGQEEEVERFELARLRESLAQAAGAGAASQT